MKIEKLRLRHFIGIRRGLGLDEITIDFTTVDGLVAFAGQNGLGKSTILENLSPYNTLASRSGALFNHVDRRDAEKELSFAYNGSHYRTLLKIDAQSGKSEGFIWKDGESLVNGKIRDYAKKINEIFGSENLFFNSVFCGQNATKLSDMTTGELKGLFAEFLRLDRLQGYEENCKQKTNVLSGKAEQIDINIAALQKRLEDTREIGESITRYNELLTVQQGNKAAFSAELRAAQEERERLKEVAAKNEVLQKQVEDMGKTLDGMNMNLANEEGLIESQLSSLRKQYQDISREIIDINNILLDEAAIYAAAENEKSLKELIESLTLSVDNITSATTEAQNDIIRLEKEIQELKSKVVLPEKDAEYQSLNMSINTAKQQIRAYEDQLQSLDVRDPECMSKTCSFIASALKAQNELPIVKDYLAHWEIDRERRANELINAAADIGRTVAEKEEELKQARVFLKEQQDLQNLKRKELAERRLELNRYQNLAGKQSEIAVAKSKKEDRVIALEKNKKQGTAIAEAWKVKKQALDDQIAAQQNKIGEITASINVKTADTLDVINHHIESTANQIVEVDRHIAEAAEKIAKLQGELSGITEATEQLKIAQEEKAKVNADIADWTYLRNACGKNGLQAMEIDATAPLISSFANDLLSKAFGPLFSVKLLTQDEDGKECLDIVVINDDGDEINLANLSGGQKIWCLTALRLAMTLLSKEKGGHSFLTAFSDESDGPLDPENAQNYVSMYRSFMDVGRFDSFIFISHRPECRSMADHVLMFEKGKNPYWN